MSFYTSLCYYRPTSPPLVTGTILAEFVQRIRAAGALEDDGVLSLELKFGESIDQDDEGTQGPPPEPGTMVSLSSLMSYPWDVSDQQVKSVDEIVAALASESRTVYRAFVMLGSASEDLFSCVTREPANDHDGGFHPVDLSVEIGPINVQGYEDDGFWGGWIALSISGQGLLWPWSLRDAVDRLESNRKVASLMELCRSTWPVKGAIPDPLVVAARRECRHLWPYDHLSLPYDWHWGVDET